MGENRSLRRFRIFAASPSDMSAERAKVETVAALLKPLADNLGIAADVLDWRAVVPEAGRAEQIILDQLKPDTWGVFIGILWHRFGTPTGVKDTQTQKDYLSGTEEEFYTAYRLWQKHQKPRILMYRCTRPFPFEVDPDQLKRVNEFFKFIENPESEYRVLAQRFDTTESFEKLLLGHLQKLLLDYGEEIHGKPVAPEALQVFAPTIPNNLPRRAAFFGRTREMDSVMRALSPADRTWGVLVDGIGGIGKTALAVEAAHRAQDAAAFDAFVFVTAKQNILAPSGIREQTPAARALDEFLNETARVLGQPGIAKLTGDEKRRALLNALRALSALLIYDNLETLSKEEQEAMADFLRELPPNCKAIITSRRRGGEGAVWLRVEKLDWDAARSIIENEMARDTRLANKLRRVEARWQELFDETNGSPLALVHTLGLMRVRAALTFDAALDMLRGHHDADLQKFIFQEARKELTENDKTALGALSFFVPSATFEAWMQVANLSRNALETTIDRLSALSLVDVLAGEERYALHPLTRAFVRDELLGDATVARETGMQFARCWVDYAVRYGGDEEESYKTFDRLEAEWTNLDAAANWLWETSRVRGESVGDRDAARMLNDFARALDLFLWFGRWDDRVQLNARAYEAMCALSDWSNAGWRAYHVAWIYGRHARNISDSASRWGDRCAQAWARGGSKREQATATRLRGLVAWQRRDYAEAERLLQVALAFKRDLALDEDIAMILSDLGDIATERKSYDEAERDYRDALKLYRKRNDRGMLADILTNLGVLALDCAQYAEARQWFEEAQLLAQEVRRQDSLARVQSGLARVWEAEGRVDLALPLAQEALRIYERLQHKNLAQARELVETLKKKVGA